MSFHRIKTLVSNYVCVNSIFINMISVFNLYVPENINVIIIIISRDLLVSESILDLVLSMFSLVEVNQANLRMLKMKKLTLMIKLKVRIHESYSEIEVM